MRWQPTNGTAQTGSGMHRVQRLGAHRQPKGCQLPVEAAAAHLDAAGRQLPKDIQLPLGCGQVKGLIKLASHKKELDSKLYVACRGTAGGATSVISARAKHTQKASIMGNTVGRRPQLVHRRQGRPSCRTCLLCIARVYACSPVARAARATSAAAGALHALRASAAARPRAPSFSRLNLTAESRSPAASSQERTAVVRQRPVTKHARGG